VKESSERQSHNRGLSKVAKDFSLYSIGMRRANRPRISLRRIIEMFIRL